MIEPKLVLNKISYETFGKVILENLTLSLGEKSIGIIGKNGCEKIINLDLNDQEMMKFSESAEAVRRMNLALKAN